MYDTGKRETQVDSAHDDSWRGSIRRLSGSNSRETFTGLGPFRGIQCTPNNATRWWKTARMETSASRKEKSTSRYVCFDIFRIECTLRAFTRVKGGAACRHCFRVSTGIVVKRVASWCITVEPSSAVSKKNSLREFFHIFINYLLLLFLSIIIKQFNLTTFYVYVF